MHTGELPNEGDSRKLSRMAEDAKISTEIAELKGRISQMPTGFQVASWSLSLAVAIIAIVVAMSTATNGRVDRLAEKVDALPDKINANLIALNQSFAAAITAAKQQPPQVILMPAPPAQPSAPKSP